MLEQIRAGADFAEMAAVHSLDRDKADGGLREVEAPQTMPDWLPPLCAGMEPGQASEVKATEAGYCIAKLERVEPGSVQKFEEVQLDIAKKLATLKKQQTREGLLNQLYAKASVHYFPAGEQLRR